MDLVSQQVLQTPAPSPLLLRRGGDDRRRALVFGATVQHCPLPSVPDVHWQLQLRRRPGDVGGHGLAFQESLEDEHAREMARWGGGRLVEQGAHGILGALGVDQRRAAGGSGRRVRGPEAGGGGGQQIEPPADMEHGQASSDDRSVVRHDATDLLGGGEVLERRYEKVRLEEGIGLQRP